MADVFDVAKYILESKGSLSTWKLQKLCYYAQAWALAWTAQPLFDEEFQAWSNGPVCPDLFREHRGKFSVSADDLKKGDSEQLTEDERDTINVVLNDYGDMQPYALRELTHNEAPWKIARGSLSEGARCQTVISKASMGDYYGSL